jgi:hypothetical protein
LEYERILTNHLTLHGEFYGMSRREAFAGELSGLNAAGDVVLDRAHTKLLDCSCIEVPSANSSKKIRRYGEEGTVQCSAHPEIEDKVTVGTRFAPCHRFGEKEGGHTPPWRHV